MLLEFGEFVNEVIVLSLTGSFCRTPITCMFVTMLQCRLSSTMQECCSIVCNDCRT